MATYVLLHGAYQGGWIWQPVATRLRAAGHTVYAPTLDGCGERAHLLRPGITVGTQAQEIARYSCCSFKGSFGSKIDQKTHARNQNQVHGPAVSFLASENVGFCWNAHAGPTCANWSGVKMTSTLALGCGPPGVSRKASISTWQCAPSAAHTPSATARVLVGS